MNSGAVTRHHDDDDDVVMLDADAVVPRTSPGATLTSRNGSGSFNIPGGTSYVVDRQAARNVLAFGDSFPGMTGTWGPLTSCPRVFFSQKKGTLDHVGRWWCSFN